jgi:hypothetical protein
MAGRKYGIGKYGAGTYDLGGVPDIPPEIWTPVPEAPPGEAWNPITEPPPAWECPPAMASGEEIWTPVT